MHNNLVCGIDNKSDGTYTIQGLTTLCMGLKESNVTSFWYAPPACMHLPLCPCLW